MLIELITIFTFWVINLEINPTITNIWLRPDFQNRLKFQLGGVRNLIWKSLTNKEFWTVSALWTTNIWLLIVLFSTIKSGWKWLTYKGWSKIFGGIY